ncbi:MAG: MoxR family ATPase [Candidatus Hydrogenedentes bacterium]|nr:MoxR family ATPase [Candidatus Hydrogenedentota bacterium]
MEQYQPKLRGLKDNLGKVILGKPDAIDVLVTTLVAGGSVLIEDVPGVGKTTLAKALAKSVGVAFSRIQFTPDLLPADILGSSIYNPVTGEFAFHPGPIFCNVLLTDEINRASPRTQSALLEAMSEMQATIEGHLRPLPEPFMVLATQNPVEFHGTYPLPEAQLDRFLVQLDVGYPDADAEVSILKSQALAHPLDTLQQVLTGDEVIEMQKAARAVHVEDSVSRYIVDIVAKTRRDASLKLGVSPRGSLMLFRASQSAAFCAGRDYVMPDDVQRLAPHVLPHRLVLTPKAKYGGLSKRDVIARCMEETAVPT